MKLLILTQKVDKNDGVLGFMHGWISEFAKHCEKVTVIALEVGEYDLPHNVHVLSLGKEQNKLKIENCESKIIKKFLYTKNFFRYIWLERHNYDNVFVHMNPEYVVLGGFLWRLWGKKIGLWYTHKRVDLKLRIAEKLTHVIFSASLESFRLESTKLNILGHGIDISKYEVDKNVTKDIDILCVGRLSKIKNQKLLLESVDILVNKFNLKELNVTLVGGAILDKDILYEKELRNFSEEKNLRENITFCGNIPNNQILNYYQRSKLSINLCPTGGMDKVVLESLLCSVPVIALNKTFKNILSSSFILKEADPLELAKTIKFNLDEPFSKELEQRIRRDFSQENLIKKILNLYQKI